MNPRPEFLPIATDLRERKPYAKPEIKRVDLALAETLSTGCKFENDNSCVGPPITAWEAGS